MEIKSTRQFIHLLFYYLEAGLVGIEPRLRVGRYGGSIPGKGKLFFLLQIGCEDHLASDAYRGYFPRVKRPVCVM